MFRIILFLRKLLSLFCFNLLLHLNIVYEDGGSMLDMLKLTSP